MYNSGKSYINGKGQIRLGKEMRGPCTDKCRLKCYEKCTDEQRLHLFRQYYALANRENQWQYLANHIDKSVPKARGKYRVRKYNTKASQEPMEVIRNRTNNVRYFLDINEERLRVCRTMFLATFDINPNVINRTVAGKIDDDNVLVIGDTRGSRKRYAENKE